MAALPIAGRGPRKNPMQISPALPYMPRLPRSSFHGQRLYACLFAGLLLASGGAQAAQTIYKSVDSTGRVIYSQDPVPGAISVDKVDVTPKVTVERPASGNPSASGAADARRAETARQSEEFRQRQLSRESQRQKAIDAVTAAERELDAAQKALIAGQETDQPGDRQGIGGVRSRPTEQYLERVRRLEAAVEAAKKRLQDAQTRLREIQ